MTSRSLSIATILALTASTAAFAGSPFGKLSRQVQSQVKRVTRHASNNQQRNPTRSTPKIGAPKFDANMGLPAKYRNLQNIIHERVKAEIDRHVGRPVHRPRPIPNPSPIILPSPGPLPGPITEPTPLPCPQPICKPICQPIVYPVMPPTCELPPVSQPPVDSLDRPEVFSGQTVTVPADGLGSTRGRVIITLGPIVMEAKVLSWSEENIVFAVPELSLVEPAPAIIAFKSQEGRTLEETAVRLMPAQASRPEVPVGSRLTLSGKGFGESAGEVRVKIGPVQLAATVISWDDTSTVIELPRLELTGPTAAELVVLNRAGEVAERAEVQLVAAR